MNAQDTFKKELAAFNRHDAGEFAAGYSPTAIVHDPQYPEPLKGTKAIQKDVADFFVAFPDLKGRVTNTLISGDAYAIEWSVNGTHQGPMPGPSGEMIPPTNKKMEFRAAAIGRLDKQGRITEERRYYDLAGLMGQLGLMP